MTAIPLTSRRHPLVQRCRQIASGRGEPGEVLLDGARLIQDAAAAGVELIAILATDEWAHSFDGGAIPGLPPLHIASVDVVAAASPVQSPQGIVAIASWQPRPADELLRATHPRLLGLLGVQDPGNVGNIIRSADALGASGVILLDGTADAGGWKALRGAMGSTFRVPIGTGTANPVLTQAQSLGIRIAATSAIGGLSPDEADLSPPVLVLIGSEGAGLPPAAVDAADIRLTIPMSPRVNSLNAATTAALVLWEMTRDTRSRPAGRP